MKGFIRPLSLSLCFLLLCLFACRSDKAVEDKSAIYGKWVMLSAFRNGKVTRTLEKTFFEFREDETLYSNLPLDPENNTFTTDFSIKDDVISCQIGGKAFQFQVEQLTDSLVLQTSLMQNPFTFVLTRSVVTESGE